MTVALYGTKVGMTRVYDGDVAVPVTVIQCLPNEVIEVLGRSTMGPRQQLYVLRFGSKLILVSQQPGETQALGEITDQEEAARLAGLCEANRPESISNSFKEVFRQVVTSSTKQPLPKPSRS